MLDINNLLLNQKYNTTYKTAVEKKKGEGKIKRATDIKVPSMWATQGEY